MNATIELLTSMLLEYIILMYVYTYGSVYIYVYKMFRCTINKIPEHI